MKLHKILLTMVMLSMFLFSSNETPTQNEVTKLYVATFNRAPDNAGLDYWVNDSGLTLEKIATSFFEQPETQTLYPKGTTNSDFIKSVYDNLFNRPPDSGGLDYWVEQLDNNIFSKNRFIEAIIAGAKGDDASILSNKTEVGVAFAQASLNDSQKAKDVMSAVGANYDSVGDAIEKFTDVVLPSLFNVVGTWSGCAESDSGCYKYIYNMDNTFVSDITCCGVTVIEKGKWKLVEHSTGGNGVSHYELSVNGMAMGDDNYPFKIIDNNTMLNHPATPKLTLERE